MTGGYAGARELNRSLARIAEEEGLGLGLGSMRAMVEDPGLAETYIVRDAAPNVLLIGNIGLPQLVGADFAPVLEAMERVEVDAIAVHLNALHEATQPEGETTFAGGLAAIDDFRTQSRWPVVVKETGGGIPREEALRLQDHGFEWVDIGGYGGTSFAAVEKHRAEDSMTKELAHSLSTWGIPTAASLLEVLSSTRLHVVASGGVRDGLDIAKCVAAGASCVGMASPMLKALKGGEDELRSYIKLVRSQLVSAMFLTGSGTLGELRRAPLVIGSWLRNWVLDRGIDPASFAVRS
jgi:isopentenyl-diphosphate delta-isomerase